MDITLLPKVELHLHLDCSLSYDVVSKIDKTISLQDYNNDFIAPEKLNDLAAFLKRAVKNYPLMQTKQHLQWVVYDVFNQLKNDNVIYAEIRFAPLLHLEKGLTPYQVVDAVEQATANAIKETGIEARLILCTLRNYSEVQSMQTVKLVEQFKNTCVVGFDIAGDEAGYPITEHINAFNYAKEKNIFCTAHAGEGMGAASVWETLQYFGPARIGHGVRSFEDKKLIQHLQKNNIHLELCPTCNMQINICDEYKNHPIDALYKADVSVNINTDCRTICNINLNKEYKKLHDTFGWGQDDFYNTNVNAVNVAFIPQSLKTILLQKLKAAYKK